MDSVFKGLIAVAGLAFALAIIGSIVFSGPILGTPPEAFSRACTNLALLAIAWAVCVEGRSMKS